MDQLCKRAIETLDKLDCSQRVFAQLCGVKEATLSNLLNNPDPLPPEMRKRFAKALTFIIGLQESTELPLCFHGYARLKGLWQAFEKNFDDTNRDARVAESAVTTTAVR